MERLGTATRRRAVLRVLIIELGLALAFASIAGVMLYQSRLAAKTQAIQQADNIGTTLQRDLERDVETLDAALRGAVTGALLLEQQPLPLNLQRAILFDGSLSSSDFGAMFIVDAQGDVTFDSAFPVARPFNFSDSPFFQTHRDNPQSDLLLNLVPRGQSSEQPALLLSRRISHPDGAFAGVAITALRLSRFKELFNSLQLGPHDDVVAVTSGGQQIYRRSTGTASFGIDRRASHVFQATRDSHAVVFETRSEADGHMRIFAHHRLRNVGIDINVGLSLDDIYASWRREAWIIGITVGSLLVLALLLAVRSRRELLSREWAESAVRASEQNFRLIADHGSDMVCRVAPDGDRRYVSPASMRLVGLPPESLLGDALIDRVEPADQPVLRAAAARLLRGDSDLETVHFRIRHDEHGERWIEAVACVLHDPDTGALDGFVSAWRDVTDRKQAEAQLAESEARYRLLADSGTDLITCLDLDLRRSYVSPASLRMLGFEPAEMLGISPPDATHPDDAAGLRATLRRFAAGELDDAIVTNRVQHKAGHYVWVEAHLSLLRAPATGEPFSILCTIRDISERKATADELQAANEELQRLSRHLGRARDAAEQASQAKSRFLASISHELRTPLNGILGYAELLRLEGGLNATQARRVEAMLAAGSHLLAMVNSVLALSEIETGKVELRPAAVALVPLAAECLELVRPAADAKGLSLTMHSAPAVPQEISTDPTRLRQILINLLGNAVKFTDHGSVALRLNAAGPVLRIEVVDTGPGIPPSRRDRLFQDFDRLGIDATRSVEGAGLGLALSHRLAMAIGGVLDHEHNPAGGSIFSLELPACHAEAALPPSPPELQGALAGLPGGRWRALVVDDVAINRDITASFLRAAGHDAMCAEGGHEAVTAAVESDFDVILMDVRMPEVDGLEATRRIRLLEGSRGRVPIVALTAQAFTEEVAACRSAGMDDHLAKPFNQAALLAVIARAIQRGSEAVPAESDQPSPVIPNFPAPLTGLDLPTLDPAALHQTAAYLPKDRLSSHFNSLASRAAALLEGLRAIGGSPDPAAGQPLAAAAHALSGSASLFGFTRLAVVARQFEAAAEAGSGDASLTASLIAAAEAALIEMHRQAAASAQVAAQEMAATGA